LFQRAMHNRFERLVNSGGIKNQAGLCQHSNGPFTALGTIEADGLSITSFTCVDNLRVDSIDTNIGHFDFTPAPSVWAYLSIALYPILGFFVPWGANRLLEWVCAGFVEHRK
jgi:hypothetical protein